jgi:CTP:molybdopterin cytidylyltransferase MocA
VIAALVLAAGEGRRYGEGVKQLHEVGGVPMLERVLAAVAQAGIDDRIVVLGAHAGEIVARVDLHGARSVLCEDWRDGQAASLHAGLEAVPPAADRALVALGDGPGLDPDAVRRLAAAPAGGRVLAADYGAGRSHPVVVPRLLWARIPRRGETPVRPFGAELVDCRDLRPPGDVDYAASS